MTATRDSVRSIFPIEKVTTFRRIEQTLRDSCADRERYDPRRTGALGLGKMPRTRFPPTVCKDASMAHHLRIYRGPGEDTLAAARPAPSVDHSQVTVSVGEVLPLLADALASRRTWLSDFEQDDITISADLYDVLLAYRHFRRPSA